MPRFPGPENGHKPSLEELIKPDPDLYNYIADPPGPNWFDWIIIGGGILGAVALDGFAIWAINQPYPW